MRWLNKDFSFSEGFVWAGLMSLSFYTGWNLYGHFTGTKQAKESSELKPTYEFSSFGSITSDELYLVIDNPRVAVGDFDGDGDQDIVVAGSSGRIFLLENKMPQKITNNLESISERR